MNGRALLFGLSCVVSLLLYSCGECSKKIDCPAYQDEVLDRHFPYQDNQRLSFLSSANEQQFFTLENVETSAPYQAVGRPYGGTPVCSASKRFTANETDLMGRTLFGISLETEGGYHRAANFSIGPNYIGFQLAGDTGISRITINGFTAMTAKQFNTTLGNRTFSVLTTASRDTTDIKQTAIYRVYYAEGEGLVGYSEYPSLKTWVKQQ